MKSDFNFVKRNLYCTFVTEIIKSFYLLKIFKKKKSYIYHSESILLLYINKVWFRLGFFLIKC